MEQLVETLTEDARWQKAGLDDLAQRAAEAVFDELDLQADGFEISLMGCSDARIAELNADFRGRPQPTNVLSWPSEERAATTEGAHPARPNPGPPGRPEELGDVAIAWETCCREAEEQGKSFSDHVTHLIVHAVLHLFGYDHIRVGDAALMEAAETRILDKLGISDPYEWTGPETAG